MKHMSSPWRTEPGGWRRRISGFIRRTSGAEYFVVACLLLVGTVFALTIPVGGGWDEETHLIRVWEMSFLEWVPNGKPRNERPFPAIYWDLSYRQDPIIRPVEPSFWAEYGDLPIDANDYIYRQELTTRSVYSPPLLLPHMLAFRYLGLARQMPALVVFYAARLFGLATYLWLSWLAVRLIPAGKWVLAVSALLPTAVFQAATVTTDSLSIGLGLLFVAGSLRMARREEFGWREFRWQTVLFGLLFLAKANLAAMAVIPFLLIRPSRLRMRFGLPLLGITALSLAVVEVGGWAAIAYGQLEANTGQAQPIQQLLFVASHPISFIRSIASDLAAHGAGYLTQMLAEFGYDYWRVPVLVYLLVPLAFLVAITLDTQRGGFSTRTRCGLAAAVLAGCLATWLSLYLAISPVGSEEIIGVQGRYFIPFVPLVGLALVGWRPPASSPITARPLALGLLLSPLLVYGAGLILSYHVTCGESYFTLDLCRLPAYKNWAPNARFSTPLAETQPMEQTFIAECSNLREVSVWLDAGPAEVGQVTSVSLIRQSQGEVLARSMVAGPDLPRGNWYTLRLSEETSPTGMNERFALRLAAGGNPEATGPRIAISLRPEYQGGALYIGETQSKLDMIFKYGCAVGIRGLVSPADTGPRIGIGSQ